MEYPTRVRFLVDGSCLALSEGSMDWNYRDGPSTGSDMVYLLLRWDGACKANLLGCKPHPNETAVENIRTLRWYATVESVSELSHGPRLYPHQGLAPLNGYSMALSC